MGSLEAATQQRQASKVLVPVESQLIGKEYNIEGNVLALVKGFINPNKHVHVSFNTRNESERRRMEPGKVISGETFKKIYIWTDEASSVSGAHIEFEYGFNVYPDVKGNVENPVFTQRRRANVASTGTASLTAGGAATTISLDDPMRDYFKAYVVVRGPGLCHVSFFGIATASSPRVDPNPGKVHEFAIEGNTLSFFPDTINDCEVDYQILGYQQGS